ncbi:hypothetical protein POV27_18390 [Aureisphaera galaxeae]|uniref:hypothetical protein n=1 Tax=Aureisphaera galaxeae TaxID=1538023 RepID=UPI0023510278|nr:hypothetical protein [Aureisphaera galaxeae]MDC8006027.1 hypothetical protein [Aureisphaera galaxeae]
MEFEDILNELKERLSQLFGEKYGEFGRESKKDIEAFLAASQEKLERWTLLLANGGLSSDDFQWLVKSQKDLIALKALERAGVSKISLGHFKNSVIQTIFDTIETRIP